MATPESKIKKDILNYLKTIPNCIAFNISTTGVFDPVRKRFRKSVMRKGTPDILMCLHGDFFAFEVKSKTGRPSKEQLEVLKEIDEAGGRCAVVRSVSDVANLLRGTSWGEG